MKEINIVNAEVPDETPLTDSTDITAILASMSTVLGNFDDMTSDQRSAIAQIVFELVNAIASAIPTDYSDAEYVSIIKYIHTNTT